jgi:pimeloyl-ACP methyl ester carboxylesterase
MGTMSIYLLVFLAIGVLSWYLMPLRWMALLSWLSRRVCGFRAHDLEVDGVRWHYFEGGQGPVLILLHGLAAEGDHWLGVAAPLRRHFRVLVPDLPGFGSSQPPGGLSFRIADQAQRLEAWLDRLQIDRCTLVGNSMGAWIAAEFSSRHPDRVRALWLQDPFGVLSSRPSQILEGFYEQGSNPFAVATMQDYRNLVAIMFEKPPHLPYPIARAGFLDTQRLKDEMPRIQSEVLQQSEPLETLAPRLTMPVLLEWGRKDRAVDISGAAILEDLLPDAELVIREEVGHLPLLECPSQSAASFLQFAERRSLVAA